MMLYFIVFVLLVSLELLYFRVADRFNIIDKPNERSSHKKIVLRGGGVIFTIALWMWSVMYGFQYPWLLAGVTLVAGVSFIDDIHSLPDSLRLVVQFVSMIMVFHEVGFLQWELWWLIIILLIMVVGGVNIFNFMDGINGITGGYSLAMLIPIFLLNRKMGIMEESMLVVVGLSLVVFCIFNFRNKAKCFAGDVGSVGIAFILAFCMGRLIYTSGDPTWFILYWLYGIDGILTLCHRIMLHENLGKAHRKHAYQIMSNELGMKHTTVSIIYTLIQLAVSLTAIYLIPETAAAHWIYFVCMCVLGIVAYILFMKKYYHLHEEFLQSLHSSEK